MKNESLIHVRFEYDEALQAKKDILNSQKQLLNITKIIKRYHFLRIEELKLKLNLNKKIKEANMNIRKLEKILPVLEIPKILDKSHEGIKEEKIREIPEDTDLESQLAEIQRKLSSLQNS